MQYSSSYLLVFFLFIVGALIIRLFVAVIENTVKAVTLLAAGWASLDAGEVCIYRVASFYI